MAEKPWYCQNCKELYWSTELVQRIEKKALRRHCPKCDMLVVMNPHTEPEGEERTISIEVSDDLAEEEKASLFSLFAVGGNPHLVGK